MSPKHDEIMTIPLQIGSEIRIKSDGHIAVSNPTVELEPSDAVADAVLHYHFERDTREHVLRLVEPLAFNPLRGK